MDWLPMCAELEMKVGSRKWLDMMLLYCQNSATEDRELALRFNRMRGDRVVAFEDMMAFIHELQSVTGVSVTAKTAVFFNEMMEIEDSRDWNLEKLKNEAKQRALEMEFLVWGLHKECIYVQQERKKMDWLQMCAELEDVVERTWFQIVALYCRNFVAQHRVAGVIVAATTAVILNQMMDKEGFRESAAEEAEFSRRISELWQDMVMAYDDKVNFIRELEAVPNIDAAVKTAKFLTDNLSTDDKRVRELINIEIEIELSSEHKGYFSQTL
ncbi:hypothetical protein Tco_0273501 [Tanacetum coccineum]